MSDCPLWGILRMSTGINQNKNKIKLPLCGRRGRPVPAPRAAPHLGQRTPRPPHSCQRAPRGQPAPCPAQRWHWQRSPGSCSQVEVGGCGMGGGGGPTGTPSPALGSRQRMASMGPPHAPVPRPISGSRNCCKPVRLAEDSQGIPGFLWLMSPCKGRQAQDEESSCCVQ